MGVIQARHDAVEVLVHPTNISTAESMHGHLKGMKNVPRILKQLQGGKAKLAEWQGLVKVRLLLVLRVAVIFMFNTWCLTVYFPCCIVERSSL